MAGWYDSPARIEYRGGSSRDMPPPWETWRTVTVWGIVIAAVVLIAYNQTELEKERRKARQAGG